MGTRLKEPAYNTHFNVWIVEEVYPDKKAIEHRFDTHVEAQEFYDTWR